MLTHKDLYLHPVVWRVPASSAYVPRESRFPVEQWTQLGLPAPIRVLLRQLCNQPNEVAG